MVIINELFELLKERIKYSHIIINPLLVIYCTCTNYQLGEKKRDANFLSSIRS